MEVALKLLPVNVERFFSMLCRINLTSGRVVYTDSVLFLVNTATNRIHYLCFWNVDNAGRLNSEEIHKKRGLGFVDLVVVPLLNVSTPWVLIKGNLSKIPKNTES